MVNTCIYSIYIYTYTCVFMRTCVLFRLCMCLCLCICIWLYLHMNMDMLDMDVFRSMYKHWLYIADAFLFIQHILSLVKLQWDLVAWPQISFLWSSIFSFQVGETFSVFDHFYIMRIYVCTHMMHLCINTYIFENIWNSANMNDVTPKTSICYRTSEGQSSILVSGAGI